MRVADEITEPPAPRPLPAPSGPRMPTAQISITLPAPVEPLKAGVPTLPRLAPVTPKPTTPETARVSSTLSLDAFLAANAAGGPGTGRPAPAPEKRKHKVLIFFGGLLTVTLLLGVIFRNSAVIERFTGKGYDTNPLPLEAFTLPTFTGAEFVITTQSVSVMNSLPTNFWDTQREVVNYPASAAKLTFDRAKASVIGGTIGTPQNVTPPYDVFVDQQSFYEPGETSTDPWVRTPHDPGWYSQALLSPDTILMYQDVIDPTLRAQHPTSLTEETRHGIPVTTYNYTFAFADFYESAPRLFELFRTVNGNAEDDASVTVAVSFDDQWMVRYLDVNVDYHSVLDYRASKNSGKSYPYRYTMDVISITEAPASVPMPANTIDATTTTIPTIPTIPVVTP